MRRRDTLAWLAATPWLGAVKAQPTASGFGAEDLALAQALRERGLEDSLAYSLVQSLCTEVGARPAGSAADERAVQWALAQFKRLGFAKVRAESLPLRVWQRGPAQARLTSPVDHPLVMTALGNSVGTPEGGLEAEIAYYADLATLKADSSEAARGRIVFIDQKTERTRDGRGYGFAVLARIAGAVEAARRGAVAVAIRSIGTDADRVAHTGAMRYDPQVAQIPAFAVSVPDADFIARLYAQQQAQRHSQQNPGGGAPLRLRFILQARRDVAATTHNVIAEVPGSDLADEIVLISAHLDSWDLGQGALDDAAGVGIVSAAAKLVLDLGVRPRRTVRVVLWGNEENGFDGANAYGERYKDVVHQMVGESDFGGGRVWQFRHRVRAEALPAVEAIAQALLPLSIPRPDSASNEGTAGPDGTLLMRRHRWPAMQLSQDGTNYFDVHHTVNDTLDKVDPATLPHNVAAWSVVAWLAAMTPVRFGPW